MNPQRINNETKTRAAESTSHQLLVQENKLMAILPTK